MVNAKGDCYLTASLPSRQCDVSLDQCVHAATRPLYYALIALQLSIWHVVLG